MRLGITGHRGMSEPSARLVRDALRKELRRHPPGALVAVSCAADGPDTWFAHEALEAGGQLEVVIPAAEYRDGLPSEHHRDYDALLRSARQIHTTGLEKSDSQAHMAGSEILVGLVDELVAVWDGEPARGYGGTADVVAYAERTGVPVRVVWPEGASRD